MSEVCATIQRDLERLEKWINEVQQRAVQNPAPVEEKPQALIQHEEDWCQQVKGGDQSPLVSTYEATPGILSLVRGSSVQGRHRHAEQVQ